MGNDEGCSWNEEVIHSVKLLSHWLSMDCVMRNTPTGLCYHLHKITPLYTQEILFQNLFSTQIIQYCLCIPSLVLSFSHQEKEHKWQWIKLISITDFRQLSQTWPLNLHTYFPAMPFPPPLSIFVHLPY